MSNVVDWLARIGQSSRLQALSGEQLAQELARAGLEPAVQAAIVQQRRHQLEQLIGASKNVCCLIHAPQDEEPEEQTPEDDKSLALSAPSDAAHRVARAG
ncbi:hypothetical protein [Steroidobacter sp.]|uniref:hypothetical protein n=1 Tax=Steroidobacter sp. TaxID=1978227 RepID=UPI001A54BC9C|nr:hypothetical protein [Steroidobacter sp.]MBL8268282.1 hypothetical protein [Steroidobacter sp.]